MEKINYISNISEEDLINNVVIPCMDEDGFPCIIIKNLSSKIVPNTYNTDNLEVKLNRTLTKDNVEYFVHIIKTKKLDVYSKYQFDVIYNFIFKKLTTAVSDIELAQLITSLEDYFKTTPEKDRTKFQIGVYGELFTLLYLYENGYENIVRKYHSNFFSKHDIEINDKVRIEVKTVAGDKRIHKFKHNQICREDVRVIISSVMIEIVENGISLFELFEKVKNICDNADLYFALEKLMKRCGLTEEDKGICCSFDLAKKNIKFINAFEVPHLDKYAAKVEGISNIEYEVDCELAPELDVSLLIESLKSL